MIPTKTTEMIEVAQQRILGMVEKLIEMEEARIPTSQGVILEFVELQPRSHDASCMCAHADTTRPECKANKHTTPRSRSRKEIIKGKSHPNKAMGL